MTSFLISGEDREKLSYVLVNRIRELQYSARIQELENQLNTRVAYDVFTTPFAHYPDTGDANCMCSELGVFLSFRWFDTNGNMVMNTDFPYTIIERKFFLRDRLLTVDQWITLLESFYEDRVAECDPAAVEIVQTFDPTAPMSDALVELIDEDYDVEAIFHAKVMLDELRAKKAAWTLELEGLRRELNNMGDKMIQLIVELALNR